MYPTTPDGGRPADQWEAGIVLAIAGDLVRKVDVTLHRHIAARTRIDENRRRFDGDLVSDGIAARILCRVRQKAALRRLADPFQSGARTGSIIAPPFEGPRRHIAELHEAAQTAARARLAVARLTIQEMARNSDDVHRATFIAGR